MAASDAAVRALLAKIGLQGLAAKFAEHGVDDSCLETIEDEDLAENRGEMQSNCSSTIEEDIPSVMPLC